VFQEKGQHLMDIGFDLFVSKPLTLKVLSETLNNTDTTKRSNQKPIVVKGKNKTNEVVLDLSFFEEQFGENFEKVFNKIAPTLIQGSLQKVENISQAIEKGDLKTINFEAHTMKGEALTFGFSELAEMLLNLEKAKNVTDAKPIFENMCLALDDLIVRIEKKLLELSEDKKE